MSTERSWRDAIAADFLESSAADFAAPYLSQTIGGDADVAGTIIGRYRLIREIGRGGMGSVWLADRADGEFEQRVALKLVRRGFDSEEILARFLEERRILARLEHPNIARLLDGGVSADGRPYFVMEYVDGVPITDYCDAHQLASPDRLRLLVVTCRAVQYAHQNLVVHQDLKPSNVMVTEQGTVKLLDFGIATLLREDESAHDRGGRRAMTPGYASPEQRDARPVTTTSDVYQLGILLHELLTGHRPDAASPNVLRGQLASVVSVAMRAEPERRYPSAEAIADDIERCLEHRPTRYWPLPWWSRAGLFLRRHHVRLASLATVTAIAIVLGWTYVTQIRGERDRAAREAAKASETAALVSRFFEGWNPDAADRGRVSSDTVLSAAVQQATLELQGQPELLASTLSMLGELYLSLVRTSAADTLLRRALEIQEHLGPAAAADLAATLDRRGRLLHYTGRFSEAEPTQRRAVAAYIAAGRDHYKELLRARVDLAYTLMMRDNLAESESILRSVLRESPDPSSPFSTDVAQRLGYVLFREARYAEATEILRPALARQRKMFGSMNQATVAALAALASSLRGPASIDEAERLDREALGIARTLYGANHTRTYGIMMALAVLLERKGDFVDGERTARDALALSSRLFGENNLNTAQTLRTLGAMLLAGGNAEAAEQVLRRSLAAFRTAVPEGNLDEGDVLNRLAYIAVGRGAPDAASLYRAAVAFERGRAPSGPYFVTDGYEYLGRAALRMRDTVLAKTLLERAVALYTPELPESHAYLVQSRQWLAESQQKQ